MSSVTFSVKGPNNNNRVLNNTVHSFIGGNAVGNNAQVVNNFAGAHFHLHFGNAPIAAAAAPANMQPASAAGPIGAQAACSPVLSKEDLSSLLDRVKKMPNVDVTTASIDEILNLIAKNDIDVVIPGVILPGVGTIKNEENCPQMGGQEAIQPEKGEIPKLSVYIPNDPDEEIQIDLNKDPATEASISRTVVDLGDEQEQRVVLYQKPAQLNEQIIEKAAVIDENMIANESLPKAINPSKCQQLTSLAVKTLKASVSHLVVATLAATIAVIAMK